MVETRCYEGGKQMTTEQKLCPLCGKPMKQIVVQTTNKRWLELWTCPPCVREGDKKEARQKK